jgi:preprotein translocase subunit SecG
MLLVLLTILHAMVCLFLIVVVLLQSGKAADLAGAFGGMGSQTAFGPRGSATLLSKATTISAIVFMLTSLSLSILATRDTGVGSSVLDRAKQSAPAQPKAATPTPPAQAPPGGKKTVDIDIGGQKATIPVLPAPTTPPPAQPAPAQKK